MSTPTSLGYALLGLLNLEPRSGYALRQVFASTPMGLYSSSPGAIYPALKSLQNAGCVKKSSDAKSPGSKSVFEITERGKDQLISWLKCPITFEDVERREGELILRFSMMPDLLSDCEIIDFLKSLEQRTLELHTHLVTYLEENRVILGEIPSASMQYGIDLVKTRIEWARKTRKSLTPKLHNNSSPNRK